MVIRRLLGFIMLLTGLIIMVFSLAGMVYVGSALDDLSGSIKSTLTLTTQSLNAARSTLDFLLNTTGDIGQGLEAAVAATGSAAQTMTDSRPLIDNVSDVITQEIPEGVEGIQDALPNIIQVAAVIDNTLETLSSVGIDREIPLPFGGSIPLRFDLGIDYNPEVPFDESLRSFQGSLDGLPESLRGLEDDLGATSANLSMLAGDLQLAADNLAGISGRFDEINPLLNQYALLVDQLDATIAQVEADIDQQLGWLRYVVIAALFFLGLTQLAPLYLGWELITGRRDTPREIPATIAVVPHASPEVGETVLIEKLTLVDGFQPEERAAQTPEPGDLNAGS
jgi:hypothetical protein